MFYNKVSIIIYSYSIKEVGKLFSKWCLSQTIRDQFTLKIPFHPPP